MVIKRNIYIALTMILAACDTIDLKGFLVPTSDATEKRVAASLAWNSAHQIPNIEVSQEEYAFTVLTDLHVGEDNKNLKKAISLSRNDTTSSFIILLGDLANESHTMKFVAEATVYDPATQNKRDTVFAITGNHDLFFKGWNNYKTYFGSSTYYFTVSTPNNTDLFIGLDSGSGTHGKRQLDWLINLLKTSRANYRNCIIFTHTNIFKTDQSQELSGNFSIEETYRSLNIFDTYNVNLVIQGHDHYYESLEHKQVKYVIANALERDKNGTLHSMKVTCNDNGTSHKLQTHKH